MIRVANYVKFAVQVASRYHGVRMFTLTRANGIDNFVGLGSTGWQASHSSPVRIEFDLSDDLDIKLILDIFIPLIY
jgi:hypothetical protein